MGMTEVTLARSPFGSYLVPGIVLFVVVGARRRWRRGRRYALAPGRMAVRVAGAVLAGWIAVQVAMIGLGHPMQPSLFVRSGDRGAGVATTDEGVMAAATVRRFRCRVAFDLRGSSLAALRSSRPPDEVGSELLAFR